MSLAERLIKDFEALPEDKKIEDMMDLIIIENNEALKELSK